MRIRLGSGDRACVGAIISRKVADWIFLPRLFTDGQPFAPYLHRGVASCAPVAFVNAMVLRAAFPTVIGGFMIVGIDDHREVRVQRLQLRVRTIAGIAQTVIRKRQDFIRREHACGKFRAAIISATAIFIDIIAHVQHEINIVARGGMAISVEFTEAQIGAREYRDVEFRRLAHGQRLGTTNRRNAAIGRDEAEPMPFAGRKIIDGDFDRMVAPWPGDHFAATRNFGKILAFGNFDTHF